LSAFEIWLNFGGKSASPPLHLPILLQVLLSQAHRLRALQLLRRYLAMGPKAVNLSLVVGKKYNEIELLFNNIKALYMQNKI
jgi:regulator-associated protein of mTOR